MLAVMREIKILTVSLSIKITNKKGRSVKRPQGKLKFQLPIIGKLRGIGRFFLIRYQQR